MPPENEGQNQEGQQQGQSSEGNGAGGEGQQQAAKPVRPEGLADDYWNEEKGVDFGKLLGSHKELSDFKTAQETAAAGRPQKAEDYQVKLPEGFRAPEGVDVTIDENDPRLGPARAIALKHGLSQEGFSELLALDAESKIAESEALRKDVKAELDKLGPRSKVRVDGITDWLKAKLGNELADPLISLIWKAKHVEAWEKLIASTKGGVPDFKGGGGDAPQSGKTPEEIAKMSLTQRILYAREETAKKAAKAA